MDHKFFLWGTGYTSIQRSLTKETGGTVYKTAAAEPSFEVWGTQSALDLEYLSIYLLRAALAFAALHHSDIQGLLYLLSGNKFIYTDRFKLGNFSMLRIKV